MALCDLRTHRECACDLGECRVQHLGSFPKTTPVYVPTTRDMLVVFVLLSLFFGGAAWMTQQAFERVAMANQEMTR